MGLFCIQKTLYLLSGFTHYSLIEPFVHFPDIEGVGTQGSSITDAMAMRAEYLGIMVSHYIENCEPVPQPSSIDSLFLIDNDPFKDDADFNLAYDMDSLLYRL